MKIVFFGSGKFAVTILEALHKYGHQIPLVVTRPDKKKGRHLHLSATPVKEYALLNDLPIFQPEDINDNSSHETLKNITADVFIVVSYGKILAKHILGLPSVMPINIHASLLPKYRGAAPINHALMAGERKTGTTFIKMNESMDKGDIIFQKAVKIDARDNAATLDEKLSRLSAKYINTVLKLTTKKRIRLKKQDSRKATYAPLMKKHIGLIQWDWPAEKIINYFRGCYGWPGSFTFYNSKLLKIFSLRKGKRRCHDIPGAIIQAQDDCLEVACGKGSIIIKEVLPESHHRMSVQSFLAGHHVKIGEKLS
ncbi:MAG TPA: methionyl-tRNA formyltransferase [Candidatus Omnitrophica bacterium]|nr:methionyl-tRNA formyltransferase [Candidatus Omnitrophota bacterium]